MLKFNIMQPLGFISDLLLQFFIIKGNIIKQKFKYLKSLKKIQKISVKFYVKVKYF